MTSTADAPLTLGAKATLACLWEATAPKPGNVYRGADFADMDVRRLPGERGRHRGRSSSAQARQRSAS